MKKIDNIMKKIKDWFTISILLSGIILCLSVSYSLLITTEKLSRKLFYWEENDRPTAPLRYENVKYGQQTAVFDKITGDYYVRDFFTADSVSHFIMSVVDKPLSQEGLYTRKKNTALRDW